MNQTSKSSTVQRGFARGPRNLGAPVEKPKEGKKALGRLIAYFKPDM